MLTNILISQIDIGQKFQISTAANKSVNSIGTLSEFVTPLLKNSFVLAGIILFILLVFGGITYIINSGNPEEMQKGQSALTSALLGFIIVFTAYWIVQIFQFITGVNIFNTTL